MLYRQKGKYKSRGPLKVITQNEGPTSGRYTGPPQTLKCKGPIPDAIMVQLRYSDTLRYQPAVGNAYNSRNVFRANSIFDPDYTGAGGQPRYRDQWAALYNKYQVFACRADHTITNAAATPVHITTAWTEFDPSTYLMDDLREQKYGTDHGALAGTNAGPATRSISTYMDMKRIHGLNKITQSYDQQSLMSANPVDIVYHVILVSSVDTATAGDLYINTTLTYYVKLFEPIYVAGS